MPVTVRLPVRAGCFCFRCLLSGRFRCCFLGYWCLSLKAYAVCLEEAGIKPKATEQEKLKQVERARIDPGDCYKSQYPHGEY